MADDLIPVKGVRFSHAEVGELQLRLPPTTVSWTINLNTNEVPTYGGQVIQILSVNYGKLVLEGRFGKEGPHGRILEGNQIKDRDPSGFRNLQPQTGYSIGLSQMMEYFQQYFSVATQGGDRLLESSFKESPMEVSYAGSLNIEEAKWKVHPVEFPSYKRSNEDFAPEWRLEMEVVEADQHIQRADVTEQLNKIKAAIGYRPYNPFSDPLGADLANLSDEQRTKAVIRAAIEKNNALNDKVTDYFRDFLPALTNDDLEELIFFDASLPNIVQQAATGRDRTDQETAADLRVQSAERLRNFPH